MNVRNSMIKQSRPAEFVRYNAVSVLEGCPLSGVPL